jgi:hypothetical protein
MSYEKTDPSVIPSYVPYGYYLSYACESAVFSSPEGYKLSSRGSSSQRGGHQGAVHSFMPVLEENAYMEPDFAMHESEDMFDIQMLELLLSEIKEPKQTRTLRPIWPNLPEGFFDDPENHDYMIYDDENEMQCGSKPALTSIVAQEKMNDKLSELILSGPASKVDNKAQVCGLYIDESANVCQLRPRFINDYLVHGAEFASSKIGNFNPYIFYGCGGEGPTLSLSSMRVYVYSEHDTFSLLCSLEPTGQIVAHAIRVAPYRYGGSYVFSPTPSSRMEALRRFCLDPRIDRLLRTWPVGDSPNICGLTDLQKAGRGVRDKYHAFLLSHHRYISAHKLQTMYNLHTHKPPAEVQRFFRDEFPPYEFGPFQELDATTDVQWEMFSEHILKYSKESPLALDLEYDGGCCQVLSISTVAFCWTIDLAHIPIGYRPFLRSILENPRILKFGVSLRSDFTHLAKHFQHPMMGGLDIGAVVAETYNFFEHPGLSLLCQGICSRSYPKPQIKMDWTKRPILSSQLQSSAFDAQVIHECGSRLRTLVGDKALMRHVFVVMK